MYWKIFYELLVISRKYVAINLAQIPDQPSLTVDLSDIFYFLLVRKTPVIKSGSFPIQYPYIKVVRTPILVSDAESFV